MAKIRKSKLFKLAFYLGGIALAGTILGTTLTLKSQKKFKPNFYNYKASMSHRLIDSLAQTFNYKQFNEITEFTTSIINNKAVAGIGTDYLAVSLIKQNLLKKIDYASLLNIPDLDEKDYEEALKVILTKETWEHLKSYDEYLTTDINGEKFDKPRHLWEYFMPYFNQDAVIAYNVSKVEIDQKYRIIDEETGESINEIDFERLNESEEYQDSAYKLINILKILNESGYKYWNITDAIRDNMLYGSTYDFNLDTHVRTDSEFTGSVNDESYVRLIKNFKQLIKDGTGFGVENTSRINFIGDGLNIVNNLINPVERDTKAHAAIIYNGDGIDAYYSSDNYADVEDGSAIRFVKPEKNLFLVDGYVQSSSISDENAKIYNQAMAQTAYQNANVAYLQYRELKKIHPDWEFEKLRKAAIIKGQQKYFTDWQTPKLEELFSEDFAENKTSEYVEYLVQQINCPELFELSLDSENEYHNFYADIVQKYQSQNEPQILQNFATTNLTIEDFKNDVLSKFNNHDLVWNYLYVKALSSYLEENEIKTEHNWISEIVKNSEFDSSKLNLWVLDLLAWSDLAFDPEEESDSYKEKLFNTDYLNINNFEYINYSLPIALDNLFIYKNYFFDGDGQDDVIAQELYKIANTEKITHKEIDPVSNDLNSKITLEYYKQMKS
ncbi:hypothetical protein [Mycoplasmopsis pullorum]|uniref:Uncharacterized protein n=1 Tax=Mycoplasmopsis pullorum TaxID=48003 RepID=A0A1L4FSI2_9BACT|nr:hypothetical protein [Mycoplasmopsis pullorum]APJ38568.1 hypothetical protein BLA55_02785 [Mycoplasmopsis pullorum]